MKATTWWNFAKEIQPPIRESVWLWREDWIHEDFNTTGVREGFYDGKDYVSCGWDACQDIFTTEHTVTVEMWARKMNPPINHH
jgi:hypothetical protein